MVEEKKSTDLFTLSVGILLGAALIYLLLKGKQTTQQQAQPQQLNWKPIDIPRVDDVKPQALQQARPIGNTGTAYKNHEKWKIIRNTDGDIESIEVIRDAKIDASK